jgi:hypothetical protein
MRLIALSIVVIAGTLMVGVDALTESRRGYADDLGPFTVVAGLVGLGLELYLLPLLKLRFGPRDRS